jgi:hypothetical protein
VWFEQGARYGMNKFSRISCPIFVLSTETRRKLKVSESQPLLAG